MAHNNLHLFEEHTLVPTGTVTSRQDLVNILHRAVGCGLIYIDHSENKQPYDTIGFWYTSSANMNKHIYVFLLDGKSKNTPIYLSDLLKSQLIRGIRMLRLKDLQRETFVRTYIFSILTSDTKTSPSQFKNDLMENLTLSSRCSLSDYLKMVTSMYSSTPQLDVSTSLIKTDNKRMTDIDTKLKETVELLKPIIDKSTPTLSPSIITPKLKDTSDLEKTHFIQIAHISITPTECRFN